MRLSLERLFREPPLTGHPLEGIAWHPDGERLTYLERGEEEDGPSDLWECRLESGERRLLLAGASLPTAREAKERPKPISLSGYRWFPDGQRLLLTHAGHAWICRPESSRVEKFVALDDQVTPEFAPGTGRLAFVRKGNLYSLDPGSGVETGLTHDGSEAVLNGKLDWVYWEELGHRKRWGSFVWSPDGSKLAFLRLDQSAVPRYPLVSVMDRHPRVVQQRYPKVGDRNSVPSVRVVSAMGEALGLANEPDDSAYLPPTLAWTPDSAAVAFARLTRDQRRLELRLLTPGEAPVTLLKESDPHWLNHVGPPVFLADGTEFVWLSERSGRAHVYRYSPDGNFRGAVTAGEWQVEAVHGVEGEWVYFTGTGEDPRERRLSRARLDGSATEHVTDAGGVCRVEWRPAGRWAMVAWSSPQKPEEAAVVRTGEGAPPEDAAPGGARVCHRRIREPNPDWQDFEWATFEFATVLAPDGETLHARLLRPPEFDPRRRYPVVVHVYGGPRAQIVQKSWSGGDPLEQALAQAGFLVWRLDNRGSWGRGHAFETPVFRSLGARELADQLAGVEYLRSLPYVDATRIGITGWSYGGFLTLYALTRAPEVWACGAAGAPVTDWTLYDTIYTERYLGAPAENPEGYRSSSILEEIEALRAPLFLAHGTDDDNVHLQHTLQLAEALSRHRKPYELLLQPKQKHSFKGSAARLYLHERMLAFFSRILQAGN